MTNGDVSSGDGAWATGSGSSRPRARNDKNSGPEVDRQEVKVEQGEQGMGPVRAGGNVWGAEHVQDRLQSSGQSPHIS